MNTPGVTPTALVDALLGPGSGITVSGVMFVGNNVQGGIFGGGLSAGKDFDDGIILSSGNINDLPLPLGGTGAGASSTVGTLGDTMLDVIVAPFTTNDAAVLKFNFVPTGNKVAFQYEFGSTEYNQFVNSQFNDVFAFFVNDVNYALVPPNLTVPVSINNVNCGQSPGPTMPIAGAPPVTNCNLFENNRTTIPGGVGGNLVGSDKAINLGGFTKTFSFIATVKPNEVNTMKLAIADTSDSILDSAVFLKGESFIVCGGPGQPPCDGEKVPEPASTVGLLAIGALGTGSLLKQKLTKAKKSNKADG